MSWARVDDGWWSHPKTMPLSLACRGLWITALSWSCQQRRDIVPDVFLAMAGGTQAEADELVCAGLWIREDGGYRIHDWSVYQAQSISEKRAEAGRKGGVRSGEARRLQVEDSIEEAILEIEIEDDEANGKQTEASDPSNGQANREAGPSRPVPSRPDPSKVRGSTDKPAKRKTRMTEAWVPDPTNLDKQRAKYPKLEVDHEVGKFRDYWISQGELRADWNAGLRTWLAKADEYRRERTGERAGGWR